MAPTWAYFDTSVLVKRYVIEPGWLRARALLRRHDFLSSAITPAELLSALSRRRRAGDVSQESYTLLLRRIQTDRARWELVEVGSTVLNRAEEIIQGNAPIQALDAIHVASLAIVQAASETRIPFITGDARQQEAARQLGLEVIWIG